MASLLGVLTTYHESKGAGAIGAAASASADAVALGTELARAPNARAFLNKLTAGADANAAQTPDQKKLTNAIVEKWKTDPNFVKNLDADLANPQTAAKLEAAMRSNPAGVAANMPRYTQGGLEAIIPAAAAAPVVPKPTPAAAPPVAAPATKVDPELARRGRPAPAAAPAEPAAPVTVKKEPAAAPAAAPAAKPEAPSKPAPIDLAAEKAVTRGILKNVAAGSDDDIRKAIDKDFVVRMADGLGDFGAEKFKELGPDAQGFKDKIKSDPALQQRIADNLKNNPQLIRDFADAMENEGSTKGIVGGAVKSKLKQIYEKPEMLADKDYTRELSSDMGMAKTMGGGGMLGGIGSWMKSTLGIDLNGIGAGLGGFFQGIMNFFGKFFNAFSSGNFAVMGNTNPKMGMFDRLAASMERAERADQLRGYEEVLPRNGAKGPIGDGIERKADGKPVMVEKVGPDGTKTMEQKYNPDNDHRVKFGGTKFYLTDKLNPMPVQGDPEGRVRWNVATEVNSAGQATKITELVLSKEDSNKLYTRMQEAAQAKGKQLEIEDPASAKPFSNPESRVNMTQYAAKTGEVIDQRTAAAPANLQPTPDQAPKVADPARAPSNDPEFAMRVGG